MKIIDSDDYASAGIETMFFPGGEPHVKLPVFSDEIILFLKLRTWADVGFAALVIDAAQRQGNLRHIFIPYFPAARQDKTDGRAALSLSVIGRLLGNLPVSVIDPHSARIYEHVNVAQTFMPSDLPLTTHDDVVGIIAPDEGARARATSFRDRFYPNVPVIPGTKSRDPLTGALSNYHLPVLERAGRYLIVDDICDGGGTFNRLAEAFSDRARELGSDCVLELFVTHGIFSKGLSAISPRIERITTTDSWCTLSSDARLTVLSLEPILKTLEQTAHLGGCCA
ncbi:MAG: hypothetical protein IT290_11450 [Deltaproteobacteria bacterium]|nr:hypothetical protein [Deltaproteobacteria bacterium]